MSIGTNKIMNNRHIRLGIFFPSPKLWMGGANYYLRLVTLLAEYSTNIKVIVFMSRDIDSDFAELLSSMNNVQLVYVKSTQQKLIEVLSAVLLGKDKAISLLAEKHNIDVFYSNATFFGWNFKTPVLYWIPDLQHIYLPKMFSMLKKLKRNIGFLAQAKFSSGIVLSSYDAKNSFLKTYATPEDKLFVVRFAVKAASVPQKDIEAVKEKYQLEDKYIFLPNQYWPHKNHEVVLRAIEFLRSKGEKSFQIVSTGSTESESFKKCETLIRAMEITSAEYSVLGLVPGSDVLALMAGSSFVLNPSLFEGWSSTVEEAKALNKKMILSDIPIHREQEPKHGEFLFFDPQNIESLAVLICSTTKTKVMPTAQPELDLQKRFFDELEYAIKSVVFK
ncbi:glycosyltransferase [Glaciecola sp. MH2013]|uniref:glycosyltransferase n=1 Tax=Glaciecola sp. MH2013 TaxID=2785524 RepID=UPI00189F5272|nr:glycosyltransferase [Glaciecola sp. MH2013]MBF7072235.1 glycosyltransferase [Glaciecola sp. MH2013]